MESSVVSASDWIKGVTLSVIATIIGGASKLAIRKSWLMEARFAVDDEVLVYSPSIEDHDESSDDDRDDTTRTRRVQLCFRFSGMIGMTFLNPLCGVLAMNYASPSITAPFSGLTLVWIVLFANMLIGEKPSSRQVFAASLIVLGEVVVAVFGDHTNDEGVTLGQLEESYLEPAFLSYLISIVMWLILMGCWMNYSPSPLFKRFAWGVSGGSLTGMQNFLKDSLTILKTGSEIPWYFPIMICISVGIAFGGLLLLTACMKRYDATYSSSMFVGAYVVSASLMSIAHYKTFQHLEGIVNYVLYPIGLFILMGGVWLLVLEAESEEGIDQARTVTVIGMHDFGAESLMSVLTSPSSDRETRSLLSMTEDKKSRGGSIERAVPFYQ